MAMAIEDIEQEEIITDQKGIIEVPGGKPYIFTRDKFTCEGAWEWFWGGQELDEDAFINKDDWRAYFLLSMKLTEGTVCVYGEERSGKSLVASYLGSMIQRLFGKKTTANFHLEPGYGQYEYIDFDTIRDNVSGENTNEFQREMQMLGELAKRENELTDQQLFELCSKSKLYNRCIIVDEAQEYVGKDRRTNLSRALGMLNRLHGHLHNITFYLSQDKDDFDIRMVWKRKTHEIVCAYESMYEETCTYIVKHKKGYTRMMNISPKDWVHLWKSTNLRGLSAGGKIKL